MNQAVRYQVVLNGQDSCDMLAIGEDGEVLEKLEDVSCWPERAERVAAVYTANAMPLYQFEEVTPRLIGALM